MNKLKKLITLARISRTTSLAFATLLGAVGFASMTPSVSAQAVNFGSVNVCAAGKTTPAPCSGNKTVTFSIPAGTTISSISILTTGIPDLDFKAKTDDTSTTLCKATTYSSATTCTVDVAFAPLAAGARNGAIELLDGTTVLNTRYIYGTGIGPLIAFNPSPYVNLQLSAPVDASDDPSAIVDAAGNIFSSSFDGNAVVYKFAPNGDHHYTVTAINDTSSYSFQGTAVDGAGNLFVIDGGSESSTPLKEIVAAGGYTTIKTLPASGFRIPEALAVDGNGNIFVADTANDAVKEVLAAGGYSTVKTLGSGFNYPYGIAVDLAGNVFVADTLNDAVKEILAAGGYTTVKTLASIDQPNSIAVDAADNIFVNYTSLNDNPYDFDTAVGEFAAADGYTTFSPLSSIPVTPGLLGVALDGSGNLFTTPGLAELQRSQPVPLAFPATLVGSGSRPQSVTVQNSGNATLTASAVFSNAADFDLVAGSGTPPACTGAFSLAPSVECSLNVEFTPQTSGPLTGSLVLSDDSGNATDATQSSALSGTGSTVRVSPSTLDFGSIPYPGTATRPITITNIGGTTLTVKPSSDGPSAVITGNTCEAGVAAGKSCTLQVEFKPASLGLHPDTIKIATNTSVNPQVPVSGTATGVGTATTTLNFPTVNGRGNTSRGYFTVINYGVPGNVTVATETGAVAFKVTSNGCKAGITANNGCNIILEYAPVQQGTQTAYLKLIPSVGPPQYIKMTGTLVP
jgi:hypothetical protein